MPRPRCTDGSNARPPGDCGGPWGYRGLRGTLANPAAKEHGEMLDRLGIENASQFDAAAFDLTVANRGASRRTNSVEASTERLARRQSLQEAKLARSGYPERASFTAVELRGR